MPSFHEHRSRFDKAEGDIVRHALGTEIFHPIKAAKSCATVILTAADNLLDPTVILTAWQVTLHSFGALGKKEEFHVGALPYRPARL